MNTLSFSFPENVPFEILALFFTEYLLGAHAGENIKEENGQWSMGPFRVNDYNNLSWQLNQHNDFWLHITGATEARLDCRYDYQNVQLHQLLDHFNALFATYLDSLRLSEKKSD